MANLKQFKQIGVGAALNAIADTAVELVAYQKVLPPDTFIFSRPVPYLPPVDDWFFLGIPAAAYFYTRKKPGVSEKTKNTVLGAFLYGAGMFIHHTILNAYWEWKAGLSTTRATARGTATGTPAGSKGELPSYPKPVNHNVLIV